MVITSLPDLPSPRGFMGGAFLENFIYIIGGSTTSKDGEPTRDFLRLDLRNVGSAGARWESLPPYPESGVFLPAIAGQDGCDGKLLYVLGGLPVIPDSEKFGLANNKRGLLSNYTFNPRNMTWKQLPEVSYSGPWSSGEVYSFGGAAALPVGKNKIFLFGGFDDEYIRLILSYDTFTREWFEEGLLFNGGPYSKVIGWKGNIYLWGGYNPSSNDSRLFGYKFAESKVNEGCAH